eukprot:m.36438 g.36438  ORF g.36438 m.36438 type:complete len:515 (-) comp9998_c1_seq2:63-1607(-)
MDLSKRLNDNDSDVTAVAFSPDGLTLATGSEDKTVCLYSTQDWSLIKRFTDHSNCVTSVAFNLDGSAFATGSKDKTVCVYSATNLSLITRLTDHGSCVTCVDFSPDGSILASGSYDKTVCLCSTKDWSVRKRLEDNSKDVKTLAFSPNGAAFVTGSEDATIGVYSTADWSLIKRLTDHTKCVTSVGFDTDGSHLATGSWDKTVCIFSTRDWSLVKRLTDHKTYVYSVAFSPDGCALATGSWDKTVCVYATKDWSLTKRLSDHTNWIWSLGYSPDGCTLATCSKDKTVCVYSACSSPPQSEREQVLPAMKEQKDALEHQHPAELELDLHEVHHETEMVAREMQAATPTCPSRVVGHSACDAFSKDKQIVPRSDTTQIFISLRFGEALSAGKALKDKLTARGFSVFLCAVQAGDNLMREIVFNISKCKLVVILGTRTYGMDTGVGFSTFQELEFIINRKKPMFLVMMCEDFEEPMAQFHLGSSIMHHPWHPATEQEQTNVPDELVSAIACKFQSLP